MLLLCVVLFVGTTYKMPEYQKDRLVTMRLVGGLASVISENQLGSREVSSLLVTNIYMNSLVLTYYC